MMKTLTPPPHFGQMLKAHMRKHRYYQSALARDIGMRRESLADLLKRPDSKFSRLWHICFALRYNFLSDLAAQLPPTMPCAPTAKDERIAELEKKVQELEAECHTLQRVIDALKGK